MNDLNPVCMYIHGFGGISYQHKFSQKLAKEFRELNFECVSETYPWRSPNILIGNVVKEWNEAKRIADEEAQRLHKKLLLLEESKRSYYLISFSLGGRVLSRALSYVDTQLKYCNGLYFFQAAIPKSTLLNLNVISDNVPVRNYYSPNWDQALSKMYKNAEGEPSAGEVGLFNQKRVENMNVGLGHKLGITHMRIAKGIAQLIAYEKGTHKLNKSFPNIKLSVVDRKIWWAEIIKSEKYSWQQNVFPSLCHFRVVDLDSKTRVGWSLHLHPLLDAFYERKI